MTSENETHSCPPDHQHNLTCYVTHKCRDGQCRQVNAAYNRWLRAARRTGRITQGQDMDSTGTVRRVRALNCLGWSTPVIFARAGLGSRGRDRLYGGKVTARTAFAIRRVYDEISSQRPPELTTGERISVARTREAARRAGWADPYAWIDADIDDPAAVPDTGVQPDSDGWVVDELAHLHGLGESAVVALRSFTQDPESLERAALRHRRKDVATWIRSARKAAA